MDGARNPKIQSIYLDKFPIHQAAFAAGGTHVVASSRRRHFYTFDLASASVEKVSRAPVFLPRILLSMPAAKKENYEMCLRDAVPIRDSSQSMAYFICRAPHFARPVTASLLGYSCLWMLFLLVSIGSFQLGAALLSPASPVQVAGLVGRPEKSLETFAACPAPDNPLVAFLGNEGCVPLVSLRSRQCVGDLKMSGAVRTAAFSGDGRELLTSGRLPALSAPSCPAHPVYSQAACCWITSDDLPSATAGYDQVACTQTVKKSRLGQPCGHRMGERQCAADPPHAC